MSEHRTLIISTVASLIIAVIAAFLGAFFTSIWPFAGKELDTSTILPTPTLEPMPTSTSVPVLTPTLEPTPAPTLAPRSSVTPTLAPAPVLSSGELAGDIPGTPLAIGSSQGSVVDKATKPRDVYALNLTAGEEIQVKVTHQYGQYLHYQLANPGSNSFRTNSVSLAFTERDYRELWSMNFAPPVTGTYHLAIIADASAQSYTISVLHLGGA
jgi:hypothetical protein